MRRFIACLLLPGVILTLAGPAHAQADAGGVPEMQYRIGREDVLQIQVWQKPDLTGAFTVDAAGKLTLPLIGEVDAAGRTPAELRAMLIESYRLLDSSISEVIVTVTQYNSRSVTVVGEVRSPGRYGFPTIPDLWAVILDAGGATPDADLGRVQIVHDKPDENGRGTMTVDLSRGVDRADKSLLPALRAKDTILVPSLAASGVTGDKFQVLGAVRLPGTYRLSAAESVVEAISVSGGGLPGADLSRVQLTRVTPGGALAYRLDLQSYLDTGRPAADLKLEPGDTVTVPGKQSFWDSFVNGVGRFAPLLSVAVSFLLLTR
jgi:polysaccharide biosynthesis/export protein